MHTHEYYQIKNTGNNFLIMPSSEKSNWTKANKDLSIFLFLPCVDAWFWQVEYKGWRGFDRDGVCMGSLQIPSKAYLFTLQYIFAFQLYNNGDVNLFC